MVTQTLLAGIENANITGFAILAISISASSVSGSPETVPASNVSAATEAFLPLVRVNPKTLSDSPILGSPLSRRSRLLLKCTLSLFYGYINDPFNDVVHKINHFFSAKKRGNIQRVFFTSTNPQCFH